MSRTRKTVGDGGLTHADLAVVVEVLTGEPLDDIHFATPDRARRCNTPPLPTTEPGTTARSRLTAQR